MFLRWFDATSLVKAAVTFHNLCVLSRCEGLFLP